LTYLQHLDESNTQVEISDVTANQTQTEEKADGDNSAQVHTTSHLDRLAAIEQSSGTSQKLGHESRERQVPCCEDDGETWKRSMLGPFVAEIFHLASRGGLTELSIVEDVLVEQDNTGTQSNPDADSPSVYH